jgi:hypothetical protein
MTESHSGNGWWLSLALFAAIVLALVIAALSSDPLLSLVQ